MITLIIFSPFGLESKLAPHWTSFVKKKEKKKKKRAPEITNNSESLTDEINHTITWTTFRWLVFSEIPFRRLLEAKVSISNVWSSHADEQSTGYGRMYKQVRNCQCLINYFMAWCESRFWAQLWLSMWPCVLPTLSFFLCVFLCKKLMEKTRYSLNSP